MKSFPLRALKAWNDGRFAPHVAAFGGGSSGSTNTIQSTTPWSGQQQPLLNIYGSALTNYTNEQLGQNLQYYPGQTYAGLQAPQQQFIGQTENQAAAGGTPALTSAISADANLNSPNYTAGTAGAFGQGQGVLSSELNPAFLNPMTNPGEQSTINSTLAQVIPQISSSYTSGNRSDSGLANRAISEGATSAVGNLLQSQYNTNVGVQNQAQQQAANEYLTQQGNQTKGLFAAPSLDAASLSNLQAGLTAAGMNQTDAQNLINAQMQQYNYGQMLPYNALSLYENAVTGTGSPGSTTQTTQPYFSNTGANIMGGVSTAASMAALASAGAQAAGYSGLLMGASPLLSFL